MPDTTGELHARPGRATPSGPAPKGLLPHNQPSGKNALLYVPGSYSEDLPSPLVVMLHGAGGTAHHSMDLVRHHADEHGFILLAPTSAAQSWDLISRRGYGADVETIDTLLADIFSRFAVDPKRVAIAGFSDGASYALSLGLMNGELFGDIIAFSPGFMAPLRTVGTPRIFMSHGMDDQVLPIGSCSRKIAKQLNQADWPLDYVEFEDGHTVPDRIASSAFERFTSGHK